MSKSRKSLLDYLPKEWEAAARREGALRRSRNIATADDLLHLNLLYLTEAGSYQGASVLLEVTTGIRLNKNAVRKRIQGSHEWLRWMAKRVLQTQGIGGVQPKWLYGRRVALTDATDASLAGSQGTDYRLHYVYDLFHCACMQMELTTAEEGEKLTRYEVHAEDIFVADRGYCSIQGMEHVRSGGGDFVIRFRNNAFHLYDETGNRMELLPLLRTLDEWEAKAFRAAYRFNGKELRPVRIVAVRKDEAAGEAARRKQERVNVRKNRTPSKETVEMSQYIVLLTSLDETPERIAELYRARWQIEQLFHRLKGLFAFGEVPGKNLDSVKAWFYGKLLVAALCEAAAKDNSPLMRQASQGSKGSPAHGTLPLA